MQHVNVISKLNFFDPFSIYYFSKQDELANFANRLKVGIKKG
jgi:hypothetical protein